MIETARELESGVEPEDVIKLLQYHKMLIEEELLLMDKLNKWFLEMKTIPDEDSVKIVKMSTKNL